MWKRGRAHVAICRWATRADLPRPPGDAGRATTSRALGGLAASPSAAAQGRRLAASPRAAAQGRRRGERSQCGVSRALLQRSAAEALLTAYMASGLAGSALSARGRAAVSSQPRAGARAASTRLSPLARRRASFVDAPQAKPPSHSLHDGVFSRSQLRPSRASRSRVHEWMCCDREGGVLDRESANKVVDHWRS